MLYRALAVVMIASFLDHKPDTKRARLIALIGVIIFLVIPLAIKTI